MSSDYKKALRQAGIKSKWIKASQDLAVKLKNLTEAFDKLCTDYESLYSILLAATNSQPDKTLTIQADKIPKLKHAYRLQQIRLDNGDYLFRVLSIYDKKANHEHTKQDS